MMWFYGEYLIVGSPLSIYRYGTMMYVTSQMFEYNFIYYKNVSMEMFICAYICMCMCIQLTLEQHRLEMCRSIYTWIFLSCSIINAVSLHSDFLNNNFLFSTSLFYWKISVCNIFNILNMCLLFLFLVRLLFHSRLFVVQFLENQSYIWIFDFVKDWHLLTPMVFVKQPSISGRVYA